MPQKWPVLKPLANANGPIIRQRFWRNIGPTSPGGGTSEHSRKRVSMNAQDYEQLTLFPADSPASHSPLPGSNAARMMTVTSGRKCSESYQNSGPLGCLVRMCLESSIWHSTRCYLTWKQKDINPKHSLFRLAVSMPRTEGTASQFWPTVTVGAPMCVGSRSLKTLKRMAEKGLITQEECRSLAAGNGGKTNPAFLEWLMGYEQQFTKLIPTPCHTDYKGAPANRYWTSQNVQVERERERGKYRHNLRELLECTPLGRIGRMNPNWVEWLMGYPIGWTELNVSETQ